MVVQLAASTSTRRTTAPSFPKPKSLFAKKIRGLVVLSCLAISSEMIFFHSYYLVGERGRGEEQKEILSILPTKHVTSSPSTTDGGENDTNTGNVTDRRIVDTKYNRSNNNNTPLRYDSSHATVMAMAQGYKLVVYQQFVGSLRKSGFTGIIMLAVHPDLQPEIEEYLLSKKVTIVKLSFVECDNPVIKVGDQKAAETVGKRNAQEANTCVAPYPDIKIRWGRYPFLRDMLQGCDACTGPVLVTDARDVYFQRDPFGDGAAAVRGLQVFAEHPHFIDAGHWFVARRVRICKDGYTMDGPMVCSGTTIGTRDTMLEFLDIMYREMKLWMTTEQCLFHSHGGDQAIMNYLHYSGHFQDLNPTLYYPRQGTVNTVGVIGLRIVKRLEKQSNYIDNEGYFIEYDGSRSRIVHQADRFGSDWLKWMKKGDAWKD